MMPKNTGMHSLESPVSRGVPSTPVVREAPASVGSAGHGGGVGDTSTDAGYPPSDKLLKRAAVDPSAPHGGLPDDDEYEEIDDLIYERTGTLCFPYPSRLIEKARANDGASARPEASRSPSMGSESSAAIGHLVRDLRAASADTPGVTMLATVDIVGGAAVSAAQRREPPTPPSVAKARTKADSPSSTSIPPVSPAPVSPAPVSPAPRVAAPQVVVAPPTVPPRRSPVVANRSLTKVARTSVASPSSPAPRHSGPSRGREARSFAADPNAERTTKPSLRANQRVIQSYPSFRQRVFAEVRRVPLAKRSLALGGGAAVLVAAIVLASSALVPRNVPPVQAATPSGVAAVVDARTPRTERLPKKVVVSPSSAAPVVDEPARATAPAPGEPHVSVLVPEESPEVAPDPSASDARLAGDHAKGAKATARSNGRASTPPRRQESCDCFPGDPLCGCLD